MLIDNSVVVTGRRRECGMDRAAQRAVREDRHHTTGDRALWDLEPAGDRHLEGRSTDADFGGMHARQLSDRRPGDLSAHHEPKLLDTRQATQLARKELAAYWLLPRISHNAPLLTLQDGRP